MPREPDRPTPGFAIFLRNARPSKRAEGDLCAPPALCIRQIVDVVGCVADAVEKAKGIVRPVDTSVLAEFESIQDPADASFYFRQHQEAIQSQLQARIDSQNNIN